MDHTAVWALVVAGATALFLFLRSFNNWYFSVRNLPDGIRMPPGDMGLPLIGEMLDFWRTFNHTPDGFIQRRVEKYGNDVILKSHLFGRKSIITVSTDLTRFALCDDKLFPLSFPGTAKMFGPRSMVALEGAEHIRMRKYVTESLACPPALRAAIPRITCIVRGTLKRWSEQGTVVLESACRQLIFNIIVSSFLSFEPSEKTKFMMEQMERYVDGVRAFPLYIPGTTHYKAVQGFRNVSAIVIDEIKERREKKIHKPDFLHELMIAKDEDGLNLTNEELSDNLVGFLLGGFRSTSSHIMWIMLLLAKHPKFKDKLREEHLEIRNSKAEGEYLDLNDVNSRAKYTYNVWTESLRWITLSPVSFRVATQDVDYKGYRIPKGWKILAWSRVSHTSSTNFDDPYSFIPDRWAKSEDRSRLMQFLIPFGGGARKCPGTFLTRLNSTMILHYLSVDYDWKLVDSSGEGMRIKRYLPFAMPQDDGLIHISPR